MADDLVPERRTQRRRTNDPLTTRLKALEDQIRAVDKRVTEVESTQMSQHTALQAQIAASRSENSAESAVIKEQNERILAFIQKKNDDEAKQAKAAELEAMRAAVEAKYAQREAERVKRSHETRVRVYRGFAGVLGSLATGGVLLLFNLIQAGGKSSLPYWVGVGFLVAVASFLAALLWRVDDSKEEAKESQP